MKSLFFALAMTVSALNANAADSTWFLCENGSVVVNSLEHRSANGKGRVTSLTLMVGEHIVQGALDDVDSGLVSFKDSGKNVDGFEGLVSLDYQNNTLSLKGELRLDGEPIALNSSLKCKEMQANF